MLPTTTAYARNAIFSGLWPDEIAKKYPDYWVHDDEEGKKNNFEKDLFQKLLNRKGLDYKFSYNKVFNSDHGENVISKLSNYYKNDINLIVFNFIDMLSHARTDQRMIKELAKDEAAYRSITKSWFEHSSLKKLLTELSNSNAKVVITTAVSYTHLTLPTTSRV